VDLIHRYIIDGQKLELEIFNELGGASCTDFKKNDFGDDFDDLLAYDWI